MASEDIVLRIKAKMDTGDVSGAVKDLQAAFNRMNLTGNVKEEFNKTFKDLIKSAETFENKAKGSFEKVADLNALKKSSKEVESLFNGLLKDLKRLSSQDSDDIFEFDLSGIKKMNEEIDSLTKKAKTAAASAVDIEKVGTVLKSLSKMTSKKEGFGLLENLKVGDLGAATADFQKLQGHLKNFAKGSETAKSAVNEFLAALDSGDVDQINAKLDVLTNNIKTIGKGDTGNLLFFADGLKDIAIQLQKAATTTQEFQGQIDNIRAENMEDLLNQTKLSVNALEEFLRAAKQGADGSQEFGRNANDAAQGVHNLSTEINDIKQRAVSFLSLENSIDLFKQGVRKAIDTVKELDKAMAETAVVTDFSIGDMWDKLPEYTQMANELGVATQGVYEASTLYYQQGLQTEQVMALTTETLKMARIAGLDCADATDLMTAALRGFNMEINETNAQRVNDVYSELAAITAADTQEIATAMTKTASIAASANMELETTAALLAQMIETTREPAETAGTAMKTIVARFTEMKKAVGDTVTVEGEEVSVNKVEEALKSAGVALRDANGEFRDLDDVLLELASKWDSLDIMTQRYIATTAAGSRQQSRFIAMMQDYDRTVELVDAAYSSAGSSSEQFAKTQESLESKLARLKNAWDTFLMGIADDSLIKTIVDLLAAILNMYNKLTSGLDGVAGSAVRVTTVFLGLRAAKTVVENLASYFINLKSNITDATIATEGLAKSQQKLNGIQKLTQRINNKRTVGRFTTDEKLKGPTFKEAFMAGRRQTKEQLGELQQATGLSNRVDAIEEARKRFKKDVDIAGEGLKKDASEAGAIGVQSEGAGSATELNAEAAAAKMEVDAAKAEAATRNGNVGQGPVGTSIFSKNGKKVGTAKVAQTAAGEAAGETIEGAVEVAGETIEGAVEGAGKVVAKEGTEEIAEQGSKAIVKGGTDAAKQGGSALAGALGQLSGFLTNPYVLAGVAIVAAVTAACIVAWKNSAGEVSKNIAAANAAALEQTEKQLAVLKEQIADINTKWDALLENQEVIDSLIQGTAAWNDKVKENNELIREMLTLYPQLADYLIIDPTTGQLSFTEEGMNAYVENLEKDKEILSFRKTYQEIIAGYSKDRADAIDNAASKDDIATWTRGLESLEEDYLEALQIEYSKYQQKIGEGPKPNADLDTILADTGFQTHIEGLGEDGYNEMTITAGTADPYVAYEYFTDINKSKGSYDTNLELMAKDYLESTDKYSSETIAAASKYYAQNSDFFEEVEGIEEETDYGTLWAKGINGTVREWKESVKNIAAHLGYTELVDSAANTYKNPETGEVINVNRVGSGAYGESVTTKDGVQVNTVSDEWLLQEALKAMEIEGIDFELKGYKSDGTTQQETMEQIADFFETNKEVASVYNGNIWVTIPENINWGALDPTGEFAKGINTMLGGLLDQQKDFIWEREQAYGFNLAMDDKNISSYSSSQLSFMQGFEQIEKASKELSPVFLNMYVALGYLEGTVAELEGISQENGTLFWEDKQGIMDLAQTFHGLNITSKEFGDYIASINFDSAIEGARKLKRDMKKIDSSNAAMATLVWGVSQDKFGAQAQFADLASSKQWGEIDRALSVLLDNDGYITANEVRELSSEYDMLAAVLKNGDLGATALAKAFESLEEGTVNLIQLNQGLIQTYQSLYGFQDLAMNAILQIEDVSIGKSETELGKIIEDYYNNVEELLSRGAAGDSQIEDYMSALIGKETWTYYLNKNDGFQSKAVKEIDDIFHLSSANGNMAGVWREILKDKPSSIFNYRNGKISWDFSGIHNTTELINKIVDEFGITVEYAQAMVGDLTTYSEEFSADLFELNKSDALASFLSTNAFYTDQGWTLSLSAEQWEASAEAFGYESANEFKEMLSSIKYSYMNPNSGRSGSGTGFDLRNEEVIVASEGIHRKKDEKTWVIEESYRQDVVDAVSESIGNFFVSEMQKYDPNEPNNSLYGYEFTIIDEIFNFLSKFDRTSLKNIIGEDVYSERFGDIPANTAGSQPTTEDYANLYREMANLYPQLGAVFSAYSTTLIDEEGNIDEGARQGYKDTLLSFGINEDLVNILTSDEAIQGISAFSQEMAEATGEALEIEMANSFAALANVLQENTLTIPVILTLANGEDTLTIPGEMKIGGTSASFGKGTAGSEDFEPWTYTQPSFSIEGQDLQGNGTYVDDELNGGGNTGGATEADKLNYAEENSNRQLEALERIRKSIDREAELIDKLPEEIAGPLKLLNMGEQMLAEYKEIQINKNKLAALELEEDNAQAEAEYLGEYYYYDEFLESYMYDVEKMEGASPETAVKVQEEYNELQELRNKINEVNDELDGGKIQKIVKGLAKASTAASKALKGTEKASDMLNDAFGDLAEKFGLADELDRLGKSIDKAIDESEFLKREFKGLGIVSEETLSKIDNLPLGDATKDLIKNTLGTNENGTIGSWLGDAFGAGGEMLGGMGDLLNFDMMSMGLDMFNQMKDMASKMIQYVVQFVQTIVNWWINREDWLYNLLSAIEQEVHNFNRQEQVEERFRLYSDEGLNDLVSAWEAMRESLEKQIDLNEQLIKSRQAELQFLNLTNLPFSPAFYYDYTEERVIENPWVYDIYILLLDIGAMIPEIGGIFSSIKQLMEDNKKRMEEAVEEIEDAREEILELEKKQLELRTKYMEDEIELEELVMDTIIEKQQEEIDELTAMNDAITAGNEKLIATLNSKLDLIRQQRDNEDKEEELGEKERRLAYLRQDTSNANRAEIYDLQDELKDERRDYTDELIDQKISALEEQNELAAEQRQKQIELLQGQLDYTEKYGLQWAEAQTLIKNGFDSEGRLRVGSELFDMLMSKEDFTSMGNGSTRQVQQIMDWNVTSIAAAAFREINDIWEEGFGNFKMSSDVHDQSRLHLWDDREVDYIELPSWLSFLQPAVNTIQDYLWRTGTNIETFIDTSFLSDKNSSSILGKTIVPLLQELVGLVKGSVAERNKTSEADGIVDITDPGYIGSNAQNMGYNVFERATNNFLDGVATIGDNLITALTKNTESKSNNQTVQKVTETTIDHHPNFYITIDGGDPDSLVGVIQDSAYKGNYANVVGE